MNKLISYVLLASIIALYTAIPALADLEKSQLSILTDDRRLEFQVELAESAEDRRQGLMFREEMGLAEGMLFEFKETRQITMWMANTILPLDMVFIDSKGCVVGVAFNTVPYSRDPIPSPAPAQYVLEINAGVARLSNIRSGNQVFHDTIETGSQCN